MAILRKLIFTVLWYSSHSMFTRGPTHRFKAAVRKVITQVPCLIHIKNMASTRPVGLLGLWSVLDRAMR